MSPRSRFFVSYLSLFFGSGLRVKHQGFDWGMRLRGLDQFEQFLNELNGAVGPNCPLMDDVGEMAVNMIRERTLQGIDVQGNPFPPYDEKYAKKKGTTRRNLSSSGDPTKGMLGAVMFRKALFSVIVFVKKRPDLWGYFKANNMYIRVEVHNYGMISGRRKARFKMPRSWWFGLTRQQETKIYQKVYDNFLAFISRVKY